MGMTHIHVSERQANRGFDGSVLVQQQISQPSTLKSGLTMTLTDAIHITRGGLQRVRMTFR